VAQDWQPIETAPKDGTDILICMPGGHSDHYYPVCWVNAEDLDEGDRELGITESCWQCRWQLDMTLTETEIAMCYAKPMWIDLPIPPNSLRVRD